MIYDVRQTTRYAYALPVPSSRQVLRLLPADRPGQRVIAAHLDVSPAPAAPLTEERDFFGNRIVHLALDRPHAALTLVTSAVVEVSARPLPAIGDTPPWEQVRDMAAVSRAWGPDAPAHYLMPSRAIPLTPAIAAHVRDTFMDGGWILAASLDLMSRLHAEMAYVPGATEVTSPPGAAFAQRAGVCQDFAHVMIDGLRGLGLPARYVSGYLRTQPPEGEARLVGADATHAWVEVWCGPEAGWIGLDPTNDMAAGGEDHIVLAIGRDYADVAPVDGVVVASGGHELDVAVDVLPRG